MSTLCHHYPFHDNYFPSTGLLDGKIANIDELDDEQGEYYREQYPNTTWYRWTCPVCNVDNVDSPETTAVPMCGNCEEEFDW